RVGEIRKDLLGGLDDDILTLRHSVPHLDWPVPLALMGAGGRRLCLVLRRMMRKSHPPDKACRYARLPERHEGRQFRATEFRLSPRGMVERDGNWTRLKTTTGSKQQEETDVEGWLVRDRDRLGVRPGGGDCLYSGQGRRAHRGQLFQQQERGGSDR